MTRLVATSGSTIWKVWLLALLVTGYVFVAIVPPFQAPDEIDHVRRAAMLADGQLLMQRSGGKASGGLVDSGLETYAQRMYPLGIGLDTRLDAGEVAGLATIRWSGREQMVYPTGTSYYFPALYLPQAAGLSIGKHLGWSIGASYLLARLLTLATVMALLAFAFRIYSPPPLALALLSLPMTVYAFSGVVLDGMATAVAVLGISAFMRTLEDGERAPAWAPWVALVALALVCACRANALPFLLLPMALWTARRDRRLLWGAIAAIVAVLAWTLFTIKLTVYPEGLARANQSGKLLNYILHPGDFFGPLLETMKRAHMRQFLGWSFIGILGWLTVALPAWVYPVLGSLLLALLLLGISKGSWATFPLARLLIAGCAVAAVLLSFLALLVQWPQAEPGVINGVQGRYLLIPALAIAYALAPERIPEVRARLAAVVVAAAIAIGTFTSLVALIDRYYLEPVHLQQAAAPEGTLVATSAQLSKLQSIPLYFDAGQQAAPQKLARIGIDFATYTRQNTGQAVLRLRTEDGRTTNFDFDIASLVDNAYAEFLLDGKRYVGGDILIVSDGGGVSVWETHGPEGTVRTCVTYATVEGSAVLTPACPLPRR